MHKYVSIVVLVIILGISCSSNTFFNGTVENTPARETSSSRFGDAWNNHCAANNFSSNENVGPNTTLGDMYFGSDFDLDIRRMDQAIEAELGEPSGLKGATPEFLYIWYENDGADIG